MLEPLERANMRIEEVDLSAAIDDLRAAYVADLRRRGSQLLLDFGRGVTTPVASAEMREVARELRLIEDNPTLAVGLEERAALIDKRLMEMGQPRLQAFARGI